MTVCSFPSKPAGETLRSRTFEELRTGDYAELVRTLTEEDILLFAAVSGDVNPFHLDPAYAATTPFKEVIAHGMWGGALISALLGTRLPGPGTLYLSQELKFHRPIGVGDTVHVRVTVVEKHPAERSVALFCVCRDADGNVLIDGRAEVLPPAQKLSVAKSAAPKAYIYENGARLKALIRRAAALPALPTAVVHPVDALSLGGAIRAAEEGLITPLLVGPAQKIAAAAELLNADLSGFEIIDAPHSHAAAARAVALVREDKAGAIMKGALHTDELMEPIVARESGLRREERMSHVFVMDVPAYSKLLLVTDAALNICPDLPAKRDIVQNAIKLAHALEIEGPKVALLSAVETVNPKMPATLDAAALCKMADRGQITGGLLDGPLAFDNAISLRAAEAKGLESGVAGQADILVAPDIEVGNMLAKQLDYLAGAVAAGLVMGARVPVILSSRAEEELPRVAACALAQLSLHCGAHT